MENRIYNMNTKITKEFAKTLVRPFVFVDVETTGIDTNIDEVVQFASIKIFPNGDIEKNVIFIKPSFPIPQSATDIHGITNDTVSSQKSFDHFAETMSMIFKDSDIGGYNVKFDIAILDRQLKKAGLFNTFNDKAIYDAYSIYLGHSPRKLENAIEFYTKKKPEISHDALADIENTIDVAMHQLRIDNKDIYTISKDIQSKNLEKYFTNVGEDIYLNFGKHKGKNIRLVDKRYIFWVANSSDMSSDVKAVFKRYI